MHCANVGTLSPGELSTGRLVFSKGGKAWILDHETSEPAVLSADWQSLSVSPFTGTIAWLSEDITFLDINGKETSVPRPENTGLITQWLQGDRVLVRVTQQDDFLTPRMAKDELYEISPEASKPTFHSLEMFGFLARGLLINTYRSLPLYDPSFRVAFYAWQSDKDLQDEGMVLWDISGKRALWEQTWPWPVELSGADWQLDGTHLVVSAPGLQEENRPELISISIDGTVTQLSNFHQTISDAKQYYVLAPKWSPDERFIAFALNKNPLEPLTDRYLYVLDTTTGVMTDFCISLVRSNLDFFWSPDSRQIAFTTDDNRELGIVDVINSQTWALEFGEDSQRFRLYGWTK
jgi:dipeptidyl aminopeptidase/acylaminoacyl peptidase